MIGDKACVMLSGMIKHYRAEVECGLHPKLAQTSLDEWQAALTDLEALKQRVAELEQQLVEARKTGMIEGVRLYAWWSDGRQMVGTCGTTLRDAIQRIEEGQP